MKIRLNKLSLLSFVILMGRSILLFVGRFPSMVLDVLSSCFVSIGLSGFKLYRLGKVHPFLTLIFLSMMIYLFQSMFLNLNEIDFKDVLSIGITHALILGGYFLASIIMREKKLTVLITNFALCSVLLGFIFSFIKMNFLGYDKYAASIISFREPGYYVLTVGLIIFVAAVYSDKKNRLYFTISSILLGIEKII
jgi:hypothetical protein